MDIKNMNMSDLKGKLGAIDKKTLIKFGIGFGAIILFLINFVKGFNPDPKIIHTSGLLNLYLLKYFMIFFKGKFWDNIL